MQTRHLSTKIIPVSQNRVKRNRGVAVEYLLYTAAALGAGIGTGLAGLSAATLVGIPFGKHKVRSRLTDGKKVLGRQRGDAGCVPDGRRVHAGSGSGNAGFVRASGFICRRDGRHGGRAVYARRIRHRHGSRGDRGRAASPEPFTGRRKK